MFIENQRGAVLVVVIVAMAALLTLGVTLSTVALSDQRQAIRQEKNNEAFYLARSGAETVAELLLAYQQDDHGYDIPYYFDRTTGRVKLGNGEFEVKVEEGEGGTILLKSTGFCGDYSEGVTLMLIPESEGDSSSTKYLPIFDMAVFSETNIFLHSTEVVNGDIGTNSVDPDMVEIDWGGKARNIFFGPDGEDDVVIKTPEGHDRKLFYDEAFGLKKKRSYPTPEIPDFPEDLVKKGVCSTLGAPKMISEDGYYDRIEVYNHLTVDVGSGTRRIRVKELFMSVWETSKIIIQGTGILELYVENSFNMSSGSKINDKGCIGQVMIYYNGDNDVTIVNDSEVYGCLYSVSKNAGLVIKSGGSINGILILNSDKDILFGYGSRITVKVLYAPYADVEIAGGGSLFGSVVCNSFRATGGSKVIYDESAEKIWEEVPDFDFGPEPDDGLGPIMNSYYTWRWTN